MPGRQILVIEDELDTRESIKMLLELEGFQVAVAGNGREALSTLEEIGPPCLILLDLMMPVMNGWEFLEALHSRHEGMFATTPVVVISAAADAADTLHMRAYRFMKKPFDIDPLIMLAREFCAADRCDARTD